MGSPDSLHDEAPVDETVDAERGRSSVWPTDASRLAVTDASAIFGLVVWTLALRWGAFGRIRAAVALAALVFVPLALRLADTPTRDGRRTRWYRAAALAQPVAALSAAVSLTLPPGIAAAVLALPWVGVTALVSCFGLWRLLQRGPWPLAELAVDVGLLYVTVGGVGLALARAGISFWFEPVIITLTAVHFHYAGFALPLIAGLAGRIRPTGRARTLWRVSTSVLVFGPALIAVGISFSPLVEVVAVGAFTTAVAVLSVALVIGVVPRLDGRVPKILLTVASVSVTVSMGVAVLYGLAAFTGGTYFGIHDAAFSRMATLHGTLNALGFTLPALVACRLVLPRTNARPPGLSFSRLVSDGRVGPDFLDRHDLRDSDRDASGMVSSVDDYGSSAFDPARVHPAVRRFYERSEEYALEVVPEWPRATGALAPVYKRLANRAAQLDLPLAPVTGDDALRGCVVPVDETADGRDGVRAWIRDNLDADPDPGAEMVYVAAYASYDGIDGTRMSLAFPLPYANLSAILRFERLGAVDGNGGLILSSHPAADNGDDVGLYLVICGFGIRLPLNETLTVWHSELANAPDSPFDAETADALFARHEVTLLGRRLFVLHYAIADA